jgi:hypothetical protein
MRRWLACSTLALLVAGSPAGALAAGVFFGFGGAAGDVDFDNNFAEDRLTSDDSAVGEWQVGYRFDSKLILEGGGSVGMSFDTFLFGSSFTLTDYHAMVGYAFQPAERFSIVPRIGLSRWRIETEDFGAFFFLPSQLDDFVGEVDTGPDLIYRVSFEWRTLQRLHLYAAYTAAHYDFGDWSAPSLGFKFQF